MKSHTTEKKEDIMSVCLLKDGFKPSFYIKGNYNILKICELLELFDFYYGIITKHGSTHQIFCCAELLTENYYSGRRNV